MGAKDSKHMDEVNEVTRAMKDIVSNVQKSVRILAGVHGRKKALEQLNQKPHLGKKERAALKTMITTSSQVERAIHFARVAVRTCQSMAETICRVITSENGETSDKNKLVIQIYVQRLKELTPQLEKARDELNQARIELENTTNEFRIFKRCCERKISEMKGKSDSEVWTMINRDAGVKLGVMVAIVNCWNPVGWTTFAVTTSGVAVVALETIVTVRDLTKKYNRVITRLEESVKSFEDITKTTEESVGEMIKKEKLLEDIAAMAQQSLSNGELASNFGFMLVIVKEDVSTLEKLCIDYLNAPDMPKDHQE